MYEDPERHRGRSLHRMQVSWTKKDEQTKEALRVMSNRLLWLWKDESGAASAEYVVLASLIAVVCIAGAAFLGRVVGNSLENSVAQFPE